MKKSSKPGVDRRKFLKGAAVGSVASLVAGSSAARAQEFSSDAAWKSACRLPARSRPSFGSRTPDGGAHGLRLHGRRD